MRRFEHLWRRWDAAVRAGEQPVRIISALSDESLVELLAGSHHEERRYERNLLATELLNRLCRLRKAVSGAAEGGRRHLDAAASATETAAAAARGSEEAVVEHLAQRQDAIRDEPELARTAAEKSEEARGELEAASEATARIEALDEELRRRQRREK